MREGRERKEREKGREGEGEREKREGEGKEGEERRNLMEMARIIYMLVPPPPHRQYLGLNTDFCGC